MRGDNKRVPAETGEARLQEQDFRIRDPTAPVFGLRTSQVFRAQLDRNTYACCIWCNPLDGQKGRTGRILHPTTPRPHCHDQTGGRKFPGGEGWGRHGAKETAADGAALGFAATGPA